MNKIYSVPDTLVFLPLYEEALLLLKRGVIPFKNAQHAILPWFNSRASKVETSQSYVSEEQYQQHLVQEYQRLPSNLQGLFSQDDFIRQAEPKRAEIEAALLTHLQIQQASIQGDAADWWIQRFYTQPFSAASWERTGWTAVWLGIDVSAWPLLAATLKPLSYQLNLPNSFPERLLFDHPDNVVLQEQRCFLAEHDVERWVTLNQQKVGLLKLPVKSIKCVLFGALVSEQYKNRFSTYWQQDLRYKSVPLAHMQLNSEQLSWQFYH